MDRLDALFSSTSLRGVWPVLHVAWADARLTSDEVRAVQEAARALPGYDDASAAALEAWLRPEEPPTADELLALRARIRESVAEGDYPSLADVGLALAGRPSQPGYLDTLRGVERAAGLCGAAAARALLAANHPPVSQHFEESEPGWSVAAMTELLDGDARPVRERIRALLRDPAFVWNHDLTKEGHRELVLAWLQRLADEGLGRLAFPREAGGDGDPRAAVDAFEALAIFDLSLVVKFGVQFGLFGGSIQFLGTERHHRAWLPGVADLSIPGGFAMTETGHGSNVRDLETRADYDAESGEFVLHTPSPSARKEWIGNAAAHGRVMTVFAQLYTRGELHGVHAFVVPVRADDGSLLDGIFIEDNGHKMGLNGVDNGRIWFNRVRVPRENLLDRYASVAADGTYSSPIASDNRRFFTMLATLVGGRVSVAAGATTAACSALRIAVRYGALRRQFGPSGADEFRILDYPTHQTRLMPAIATAYALQAAVSELKRDWAASLHEEDNREIELRAAGIKAAATWFAIDAAQVARECCGGQGFLSRNRIPAIRTDVDVFATFEGDNTVLLQLVARGLLGNYADAFRNDAVFALIRQVGRQASARLVEKNPVAVRQTDEAHLRDATFHLEALRYREHNLLVSAARRVKKRIDGGIDPFVAFTQIQTHLVALAMAHVERTIAESFARTVDAAPTALRPPLERLRALHALHLLHRDAAWFLEDGYFAPAKARALRKLVDRVCAEVRPEAVALVDAFGIPEDVVDAPIAGEYYIDRAMPTT